MVILPHRRKSFRQVASGGGGGDPNFADVSVLLHLNGTNGGTAFLDSSLAARVVTPSGNIVTSTAQSKFGGSSAAFDGSGDYLTVGANAAFDFALGAVTIEWWYRFSTVSGYHYFYDIGTNGTYMRIQSGSTLSAGYGGSNLMSQSIPQLSTGIWYHMAYVRTSGGDHTLYINGSSTVTTTDPVHSGGSSSASLRIGEYGGGTGYGLNGWMNDFRITKGVARYTTTFTPPTAAFPDS